jgi:hypothetical protein
VAGAISHVVDSDKDGDFETVGFPYLNEGAYSLYLSATQQGSGHVPLPKDIATILKTPGE